MDDSKLDQLMEALTLDESRVEAQTPLFTEFSNNPLWWNYFGRPFLSSNMRRSSPIYDDIEYRNPEGKLHRLYGPAYISKTYNVEVWYKDGKLHRIGGPAYIHNLNMVWFKEGILHRLDGPAVVAGGGPKQYWIDGIKFSPKQYKWEIGRRKKRGLIK